MTTTHTQHHRPRWSDVTLAVVFVVLLCVPFVAEQLEFVRDRVLEERRALAPRPQLAWNWRALAEFPGQYDKYYNDHFGLRGLCIAAYNSVLVKEFGASPRREVILGKDRWLYYGARNAVDVYRSPDPFTEEELDNWRWNFLLRREWLSRKGIPYVIVIVPEKPTIYPEYLPDGLVPACTQTRTDQLVDFLKATTDLEIVDTRGPIRAAKDGRLLYYKADTHWNPLGAFLGYREMIKPIARLLPSIRPLELSDFTIHDQPSRAGDLAGMLSLGGYYHEESPTLTANFPVRAKFVSTNLDPQTWSRLGLYTAYATETGDATQPRAVVMHDSFFYGLIPYFDAHFSRAVYLHMRPDRFAPEIIEKEQPDIVVQQIVERWFGRMGEGEAELF